MKKFWKFTYLVHNKANNDNNIYLQTANKSHPCQNHNSTSLVKHKKSINYVTNNTYL